MLRRWLVGGLLLVLVLAALSSQWAAQDTAPRLVVYFLDIEQGNCILVVSPSGTVALIDAGTGVSGEGPSDDDPVSLIRGLLDSNARLNLQYVIATHYDADHIGKLDKVLNAGLLGPNGTVLDRGDVESTDAQYVEFERGIGSHRCMTLEPGMDIDLGCGAVLRCVAVNGSHIGATGILNVSIPDSDENSHSAAFILTYGNAAFWFGGDLTSVIEAAVAPYVRDVDVYAVDHHGSKTSSCLGLLRALRPEYAIIQSGQDNSYGHPNKEIVNAILGFGDRLGGRARVIYQNHAKPGDARSDDMLAYAIADPDGSGPLPGTIAFHTDGVGGLVLTIPTMASESQPTKYVLIIPAAPQEGGIAVPAGAGEYHANDTFTVTATLSCPWRLGDSNLLRRSRVLLTRHRMEGRRETRTGRLHKLLLPIGDPRPERFIKSKLAGLDPNGSDPCRPMGMRYSAEVLSQTVEG